MHVYLIRHGETLYNRNRVHQHASVPLSERGREQSRTVGVALAEVPNVHLLTSDLARARETAEIIGDVAGVTPHAEPLFREMRRPQQVVDTSYYGFTSLTVGLQLLLHAPYATWHYAGEENLHDIRTRVCDAIAHLEALSGTHEHVAVVSHAVFIKLFIEQLTNQKISLLAYLQAILKIDALGNGCIAHATCTPDGAGGHVWTVDATNDCDHITSSAGTRASHPPSAASPQNTHG